MAGLQVLQELVRLGGEGGISQHLPLSATADPGWSAMAVRPALASPTADRWC
jgi:hypothetical protein